METVEKSFNHSGAMGIIHQEITLPQNPTKGELALSRSQNNSSTYAFMTIRYLPGCRHNTFFSICNVLCFWKTVAPHPYVPPKFVLRSTLSSFFAEFLHYFYLHFRPQFRQLVYLRRNIFGKTFEFQEVIRLSNQMITMQY